MYWFFIRSHFLTPRKHAMQSAKYQTTTPLKFLIVLYYYANVLTINQSKSLPGFWVVTSLDSINGRSLQTLLREKKTTQSNSLNLGYPLNYLHVPTCLPTYLPTFLHAHSPYPPTHPPTYIPTLHPFTFLHSYLPSTYHPCTSVLTYLARLKYIVPYDHFTGRNSSSCGIEGKRSRARAKFWLRFIRKWSCIFFWSWLEIIFLYWIMKWQWI